MSLDEVFSKLPLEEKIGLLAGRNQWETTEIARLGIPAVKTTDGPSGARGSTFTKGVKGAFVPCSTSLAAAFHPEAAYKLGSLLGRETQLKSSNIILAPTICIHRSPLGGRNFESFSEDPFLTAILGTEYVKGVQSHDKVYATIKHFVGNEQETRRFNVDNHIPEQALHEVYLRPFEWIVKNANPGCVMTSYNLINGTHADMNTRLIQDILRDEWGFQGMVMSDWGGTNSVAQSIKAGMDLEMPNRAQRTVEHVQKELDKGTLKESDIDKCARRVLKMVLTARGLNAPSHKDEKGEDREEDRAFLRKTAGESIVLLENKDGVLPIKDSPQLKIAVIGKHAKNPVAGGGGSANLNPYYLTTPLESLQKAKAKITYTQATYFPKHVPFPEEDVLKSLHGKQGYVSLQFWKEGESMDGKPFVEQEKESSLLTNDTPEQLEGTNFSYLMSGSITPKTTGTHTFGIISVGRSRLYVDSKLVIDNWNWKERSEALFTMGSKEAKGMVSMKAGQTYKFHVENSAEIPVDVDDDNTLFQTVVGLRVGFEEADSTDWTQEAVQAAENADVALVFVGQDNEWESEGHDRDTLDLPGNQNKIIEAVAKANPKTVVIAQTGCPFSMPWKESVSAIVEAWYQGQENGNAIADVIFGRTNPSGKLPVTFPRRLEDTPSYGNYPGKNDRCDYVEGIHVGYRHYLKTKTAPLYEFGYGLSYTSFQVSVGGGEKQTIEQGSAVAIPVSVKNTGKLDGDEIVQVYATFPREGAVPQLAGFQRVHVKAGETAADHVVVPFKALEWFDEKTSKWVGVGGQTYKLHVGTSSQQIVGNVTVRFS